MKPIKVLELSEVDRLKLEKGYHNGPTHSFRIRCKSILLKSEGKSVPQIAEMLKVTVPTVYTWVKRYEENGIKGLETRPGQGRKPIMDCSDEEAVRKAIVDYLDRFSSNITKKTVIVLDHASVHRNRKVKELRNIWEKRGLYLFYLPPYSPELNPAEILWRILKCKWIRPIDYETTDSLFYSTNRALASVGTNLFVNYSYL